jgi:hypothetical protein
LTENWSRDASKLNSSGKKIAKTCMIAATTVS